jgi:hypothetical protein
MEVCWDDEPASHTDGDNLGEESNKEASFHVKHELNRRIFLVNESVLAKEVDAVGIPNNERLTDRTWISKC